MKAESARPYTPFGIARFTRLLRLGLGLGLLGVIACAPPLQAAAVPDAATRLQQEYQSVRPRLASSHFERPLVIDSSESADKLTGEVHAVIDQPFDVVNRALRSPATWCDILILHLNTKSCKVEQGPAGTALALRIGKKVAQAPDDAHRVDLNYRVTAASPAYLGLRMNAADGPLGTRDYRIVLEAIPLANRRSFLRFSYAYRAGLAGEMAIKTYLATLGSRKVGFTVKGRDGAGKPDYIGGVRGVVERNTMRYFLAIEAYFNAQSARPEMRIEQRLRNWFAATERYPRQLHEIDREAYLAMKREELRN